MPLCSQLASELDSDCRVSLLVLLYLCIMRVWLRVCWSSEVGHALF